MKTPGARNLVLWLAMPLLALPAVWSQTPAGAALEQQIRNAGLDPTQAYQVRDLSLRRDDIKLYFNDGFLIFSQPVNGRRLSAVFAGLDEPADGEVLLLPPSRDERESLAKFTGAPNLDEHFRTAVVTFTDNSAEDLLTEIGAGGRGTPAPEAAPVLVERWNPVLESLAGGFSQRLVADVLSPEPLGGGLLFMALSGKRLGNFDVMFDPLGEDQILAGRLAQRGQRLTFDIWTSFPSRAVRLGLEDRTKPAYEMGDYHIDALVDQDLWLEATTRATLTIREEPVRVLSFGLSRGETVTSVMVDGEPAEILYRESIRGRAMRPGENDVFLVIPAATLPAGSAHQIEFEHEGAVILDHGSSVYSVGARSNWYPRSDIEFSDYDIQFTYPARLTLAAAGEVVEDSTEGGWRTTRRQTRVPVRLAGFNLGNYKGTSQSIGDLTVEVYGNRGLDPALEPPPTQTIITRRRSRFSRGRRAATESTTIVQTPTPPDPTARLEAVAADVSQSLEFFSELFGPPPIHSLTVTPVPGTSGQGFPGLIYLSTLSYLDPGERPVPVRDNRQDTFFSYLMVAHEVAHQWWGNLIAGDTYRDEWMMEALAHYSALLWLEKRNGSAAMQQALSDFRGDLLMRGEDGGTLESFGPVTWGYRLESAESITTGRIITYEKGAWVFHMLRQRLGDERFFAMLAALRERYAFKLVGTQQLQELAKEFLPEGVRESAIDIFFENWVYATGIPSLRLQQSTSGRAPNVRLTGTVAQDGVSSEFSVQVPITVRFAQGDPLTFWVTTGEEPEPFSVELPQTPVSVTIDRNRILAR